MSSTRLDYLDGVRGLSALYVVAYHAHLEIFGAPAIVRQVVGLGRFSVTVFIVLSGYCLALPVVRKPELALSGGFAGYIRRRARRILPPYYAALAISLAMLALPGWFATPAERAAAFAPMPIWSHLLLFHNLRPAWALAIDPPLWSVATEWQIYFLYGLVLLPVWRRFGALASILVGFAVGLFPFYAFGIGDLASPWYAGVFALGMVAAAISRSTETKFVQARERIAWAQLAATGFVLFLLAMGGLLAFGREQVMRDHLRWVFDTLLGLATAALLIACTRQVDLGTSSLALRIFGHPAAVFVGSFSYSIYVFHTPVIRAVKFLFEQMQLGAGLAAILPSLAGVAAIVGAYGFFWVFERPFVASSPRVAGALSSVTNKEAA